MAEPQDDSMSIDDELDESRPLVEEIDVPNEPQRGKLNSPATEDSKFARKLIALHRFFDLL